MTCIGVDTLAEISKYATLAELTLYPPLGNSNNTKFVKFKLLSSKMHLKFFLFTFKGLTNSLN